MKHDYSFRKELMKNAPKAGVKKRIFNEVSKKYDFNLPSYERKLEKFDKIFNLAEEIAFEKRNNPKTIAKLRENLIKEYYYYNDSLLSLYESPEIKYKTINGKTYERTIKSRSILARKTATINRLSNFLDIYGDEKIEFDIKKGFNQVKETMTWNEAIKLYQQGKISRTKLFERLEFFKKHYSPDFNIGDSGRKADYNEVISSGKYSSD